MTTSQLSISSRRRERGQTIVIALIVLGLLLVLGFVFLGIINRNIQSSGRLQDRSEATDLAEAGARYAHSQLLQSEAGADWFGNPTGPLSVSTNTASPDYAITRDPDALYLRGPAMTAGSAELTNPDSQDVDRGGPDGLGPYFRVNFANGRALVRVRYAPSDANLFSNSPTGPLRNPGSARNYIIVDSVGRVGKISETDPTTLNANQRLQFRNFSGQDQFNLALAGMKKAEAGFANNRKITAFVSLGITDTARFITNLFKVTRAADIGYPAELGAVFGTTSVSSQLAYQLGSPDINVPGAGATPIGGLGSFWCNANVMVHGHVDLFANPSLGDRFVVIGALSGDTGADLTVNREQLGRNPLVWRPRETVNLSGASLNSQSDSFDTVKGTIIDGKPQPDINNYARGAGYKTPPSISTVDPETGENRYVQMTRESGTLVAGQNSGLNGHGRGVYVGNYGDRQTPSTEGGRAAVAEDQSLVYDWLNPNNGQAKSGWVGPYYVPSGASVYFLSDGFTITRDARGPAAERFWRNASGVSSGNSTIRFRLGRGSNGLLMVVNSLTAGIGSINGTLTASDYDKGFPFNGVLYFEGNARVRGIIPTDVQLTLVSAATIYVEGSLTKGTTGNDLTASYSSANGDPAATGRGIRISGRPSRSMLALLAKDYVAVNTTMFFGPDGRQGLDAVQDTQGATNLNPIRMKQDGALAFQSEFLLDPNAGGSVDANNPATWPSFNIGYVDSLQSSKRLNTKLLVTHTMDDGPATLSLVSLNVNPGAFDSPTVVSAYHFPNTATDPSNAANDGSTNPSIPIYGLGGETWQRYPKFESVGFDLIKPTTTTATTDLLTANDPADPNNQYRLFTEGLNDFLFRPNFQNGQAWNDYLIARTALVPHDIRIEATMYAQEGSFFIIPGPWFNPNPNDRRDRYEARVAALGGDANATLVADSERQAAFGASRDIPFYGEPLDVRVVINGAVAENMPPPISQQTEWLKKWGWIPGKLGASGNNIPVAHTRGTRYSATTPVVPNFTVNYDPTLATAKLRGFAATNDVSAYVRTEWIDYNKDGVRQAGELRPLPPLPRLPVSPTLAYFGEVN